jgi:hypothetical protein
VIRFGKGCNNSGGRDQFIDIFQDAAEKNIVNGVKMKNAGSLSGRLAVFYFAPTIGAL